MAFHRNTDITLGDFSECIDTTIEWRTPCIPATLACYILKMDGLLVTVIVCLASFIYLYILLIIFLDCECNIFPLSLLPVGGMLKEIEKYTNINTNTNKYTK
jgi:hypothetical protein